MATVLLVTAAMSSLSMGNWFPRWNNSSTVAGGCSDRESKICVLGRMACFTAGRTLSELTTSS